jgi:N-acetylglucosamine-6-phosphate deacetylase
MVPRRPPRVNRPEPPVQIDARHWETGRPVSVWLAHGTVAGFGPAADRADLPWVAPSFCDLQVNGGLGVGFNDPDLTAAGVRAVADECRRRGCGRFLPTVITDHPDAIERSLRTLAAAVAGDPALAAMVPGFHLEGPFISPADGYRGAHPARHVCDPSWDLFARWQDAAGGRIRLVTLAPERPGALALIERLTAAGVVVALGHTAADAVTISTAVSAGARLSTHLGNGLPATLPRHANPLWPQLADDRLRATVIADGHHLPADVLTCIARVKTSDRLVLVSDASPLAGLPAGNYELWGRDVEVTAAGRVALAGTPYLAGSGGFIDGCVAGAVRHGGLTVAEAVLAASVRPRELLGLPVPALAAGEPAELVLFDLAPDGTPAVRRVVG